MNEESNLHYGMKCLLGGIILTELKNTYGLLMRRNTDCESNVKSTCFIHFTLIDFSLNIK